MVKLLEESKESKKEFDVKINDLLSLEDVISGAEIARRPLDREHLETLVLSDPRQWPPILITKTDKGYVIIDGYHRKEAAIDKGLEEIRATSKTFKTEQEVIEATFQANLSHGLKSSPENRSKYAYWLHLTYPDMDQKEIARRAGIRQSTVSIAIARREAAAAAATAEKAESAEEEQREHARRTFKNLTRNAIRLLDDIGQLEQREQRAIIIESLGIEERERLLAVTRLLEEVLQPKAATARRPRK